ncbi:N-acetyltransferase [Lacibacter luteus]|uniref:N-acetyltransferase n=1 Tax=Lacibacter luteus TaxID=2508719 RepID=A0A4Q1CJI8_9BACT|nr:GNAT family N-acetyltransferase [Lacibacter luteus]RXK60743.1 N-acetyltransferase [Lacibacter luteus]
MFNKIVPTIPVLITERLTLRQLLETDATELFLLRSDETINKHLDRKPAASTEDALNFIRNIRNKELLYWAITETQHEELIGTICLFDFSKDGTGCEMGFELLTGYRHRGIMHEAAKKISAFAANTLAVKTIDAITHKDNLDSIKLLQKLSFEQVGFTDEANSDLLQFRLLVGQ